jgi:curved DNA-binding protein
MDYYATLGLAKTSTPEEIKKAYRKLASQHHPDKGGDTAMFQKIEEAYRILSDPQKRQQYDNPSPFGQHPNGEWQQAGGFGGFDPSMFSGDHDPRDIFSQIFGQRAGNPFANQRNNRQLFRTTISVTLEDAYTGSNQILKIQTPTGQKVINIEVPKGLHEQAQVKYDNVIDNGTLLVEFKILPNLRFERRNHDLYCNQKISVLDLIVGTTINFTTISGKEFEVRVPPKTQPYMQLKIAGQGMPIQGSCQYGDQILLLKPYIPDTIDDEITQSILRSKSKT